MRAPKKILILSADTGGGHDSVAAALQQGLTQISHGQARVVVADPLRERAPWPFCRLGAVQSWMGREGLWLMRAMFWADAQPWLRTLLYELWYPSAVRWLGPALRAEQPDLIVSVHPHMTQLGLRLLSRRRLSTPFVIMVTELVGAPAACFHRQTDLCLVATEAMRRQAIQAGLREAAIRVTGIPVDLRLAEPAGTDPANLKSLRGWDPSLPLVVMVGGGEGYGGPIEEIALALDEVAGIQLALVTGRNRALYQRLSRISWRQSVRVLGFVDLLGELLPAADVLISKAGTATLAEALALGLPTIIFAHFPGPEAANMAYVVEHGAGLFIPDPQGIARQLSRWLVTDGDLQQAASQALALGRPQAALEAARAVWELLAE